MTGKRKIKPEVSVQPASVGIVETLDDGSGRVIKIQPQRLAFLVSAGCYVIWLMFLIYVSFRVLVQ